MPIEFLLSRKLTPFGLVSDPRIPVTVYTHGGVRTYRFLVGTGADFSLAPRRLAEEVGLEWDDLHEGNVVGIERQGTAARLGRLQIRIGTIDLAIRCLFVDGPRVPFILGRADFLDRFVLIVDTPGDRIILEDVGSS